MPKHNITLVFEADYEPYDAMAKINEIVSKADWITKNIKISFTVEEKFIKRSAIVDLIKYRQDNGLETQSIIDYIKRFR